MLRASLPLFCLCAASAAQEEPPALTPPKVVSMKPRDGGALDPAATELVVTFDRDMFRGGYSVCGGGPDFPKIQGRPQWRGDRTLVIPVQLKPDHEYNLSLNCSSGRKIRSKEGATLTPTRWSFTTFPAQLRPWPEQQQRNLDAFERLRQLLATRYSYRDRVVSD
ncbi:MAG: Ig-like domain-containing protein, partial [Planctomycetota bacterium]